MQGQRLDGVALTFASASIIELPQTFTVRFPPLCGHPTMRDSARGVSNGIKKQEEKTTTAQASVHA